MDPAQVSPYLNSFVNFESKLDKMHAVDFNLDRIRELLDLAGDPAKHLKIIHVAGTKGKGSTCAFLASILHQAGYKVGLYTSPHLHRVNERIRVLDHRPGDGCISDEELAVVLTRLRPLAAAVQNEGHIITYFEILTVAALLFFAGQKVDMVILETGLGGRLDATNAAPSLIAVITPISLDHVGILGPTLEKIAVEKAGIIKNSLQKVVIAPQDKEAMDVLLGRCREFGIQPHVVSLQGHENLKTGLKGRHQKLNAATALAALNILSGMGFEISAAAIAEGLKKVFWPGRFELLASRPDVIADGAHNKASASALVETLKEEYPGRRVVLILGVSKDKDVEGICAQLNSVAAEIILTKAVHSRAYSFVKAEGEKYFKGKPCELIGNLPQALEKALRMAGPEDVIVVTGSLFIVAEAREECGAAHSNPR